MVATTVGKLDPDFKGQTTSEPPYAVVPRPASMFAARSKRFAQTAAGSEIESYLRFLAILSAAQAEIAATLSVVLSDVETALANGMPPLPRDLAGDSGADDCLGALLAHLSVLSLEPGPAQIVANLAAMDDAGRQAMLIAVGDGLFEIERLGESGIVAAALQVWYALHAEKLQAERLRNIGETICPTCGGAPASSTIVGWPGAEGNRYLTCSLCMTMWNHVRIKCTACGSTKGISYRSIEGSIGDVAAEVCDSCQGYVKHLNQTKNALLDPVADDVASYGLDMLLREDGWRRTGLNPFLILAG